MISQRLLWNVQAAPLYLIVLFAIPSFVCLHLGSPSGWLFGMTSSNVKKVMSGNRLKVEVLRGWPVVWGLGGEQSVFGPSPLRLSATVPVLTNLAWGSSTPGSLLAFSFFEPPGVTVSYRLHRAPVFLPNNHNKNNNRYVFISIISRCFMIYGSQLKDEFAAKRREWENVKEACPLSQ